jgi:uncharacterized BrkB/YihY/UPF0761 family membrane protein
MKLLEDINLNQSSKICLTGLIYTIVVMFVLMAVVFLWILATKLPIVMSQPSGETYTYFVAIIDRILLFVILFVVFPLSLYQILSKNKSKSDVIVSAAASAILLIMLFVFAGGEMHYFKKYSNGELSYSQMFCNKTFEMKIFDNFVIPPQMCLPSEQRPKNN